MGKVKVTPFVCPILCRIILKKGKSIRQVMEEQGVLQTFLKNHPKVDPAAKYLFNNDAVAYEPFTNYLDVSEGRGGVHNSWLITILRYSFRPLISSDFGLFTKPKSLLPQESIRRSYELVPFNTIIFPLLPSFLSLLAHSLKLHLHG